MHIQAAVLPDKPTDLRRVEGTEAKTSIELEWTRAYNGGSDITGYQVWWNDGGSGPVNVVAAVINEDTPYFKATGLVTGMYYGFSVKAVTDIGTSELSEQFTLMSADLPDAPSQPVVVNQDET